MTESRVRDNGESDDEPEDSGDDLPAVSAAPAWLNPDTVRRKDLVLLGTAVRQYGYEIPPEVRAAAVTSMTACLSSPKPAVRIQAAKVLATMSAVSLKAEQMDRKATAPQGVTPSMAEALPDPMAPGLTFEERKAAALVRLGRLIERKGERYNE